MLSRENLDRSLAELGVRPASGIFDDLQKAYSEPGRHYHTCEHIAECLEQFQTMRDRAIHPAEIEVAIWFHDAVYDTRQSDNEEKSAEWARSFLESAGAASAVTDRVVRMILATKTHEPHDWDAEIMLDVDLAILGALRDEFEKYDAAIRQEYDWVPDAQYRESRARILSGFLDRPVIYRSALFFDQYEKQARRNLAKKIAELRLI